MARKKFEYRHLNIKNDLHAGDRQLLKAAGAEGWQVVATYWTREGWDDIAGRSISATDRFLHFIMMREI